MEQPEYIVKVTVEEVSSRIIAACDDCGSETSAADLYDSPWIDDRVRCGNCLLRVCGYDVEAVDKWARQLADIIIARLPHHFHKQLISSIGQC